MEFGDGHRSSIPKSDNNPVNNDNSMKYAYLQVIPGPPFDYTKQNTMISEERSRLAS